MKAKELMIGDWVLRNNISRKITRILDYGRISVNNPYGQYESDCGDDDIEPIPLTSEILEKNGGQLLEDNSNKKYWIGVGIPIIQNANPEYGWDIDFCDIKYVHELQHALRLCGLKELADDFKV